MKPPYFKQPSTIINLAIAINILAIILGLGLLGFAVWVIWRLVEKYT